jgi:uncharacterized protein DUF6680
VFLRESRSSLVFALARANDNRTLDDGGTLAIMADFWNLRATDIVLLIGNLVMIWVVAKAPGWAVSAQWRLQLQKEGRDRRLRVFTTLMRTRAMTISPDHVQALNMIDVEFCSESISDQQIREAWRHYLHNLNIGITGADKQKIDAWNSKNRDYLADLLSKMGTALGYKFDFPYIKENVYYPQGHVDVEGNVLAIQSGLVELLKGEKSLKMEVANPIFFRER